MLKKSILLRAILPMLIATLTISSCVRERDTDTGMAAGLAMHEFVYHDASDLADDAATKNTGENLSNYKTRGYCATLTHDKASGTIVIDFGAANCMCNDGRNRRGKILVSYTGNYADSGSVHTITFDQYFVNDYHVMGTTVVENKGKNGAAQPYFSSTVAGKMLKPGFPDTLYYDAQRTITWLQGSDTPVWGDDIYSITGLGSGRDEKRAFYAMNITEPLIKDVLGCRYFVRGRIEMQPQGKALRTLDYGEGTCDRDATVTINNKVYRIQL